MFALLVFDLVRGSIVSFFSEFSRVEFSFLFFSFSMDCVPVLLSVIPEVFKTSLIVESNLI